MAGTPYSYNRLQSLRYNFTSRGRKNVEKVVEFTPLAVRNVFNIGFGDLKYDGTVDDKVITNNGDIIRVLSTIIHIIDDFMNEYPFAKVVFTGSTPTRTKLYQRILNTYWSSFTKQYDITALEQNSTGIKEVKFKPNYGGEYIAFFIKRKQ
jgi:hypothetical protein